MRAALLLLVAALTALAAADTLYLTVLYCPPGLSSSKGATVTVDPVSGAWNVVGTFDWGKELGVGCLIEEDPTVYFDTSSSKLYMDFLDNFAKVVVLDVATAQIVGSIPSKDAFFTGFENMALQATSLVGVSGTVTQHGYCSDGCFQYGAFATASGQYKSYANIPFKAAMDDSHFLDNTADVFYIQASYDLRAKTCGPEPSSLCLLSLNGSNGALNSAIYTNYTIYKYAQARRSDGTILAFLEGFTSLCKHPYDDYLFATVNLTSAVATPIACIPKSSNIDMDEWISSFSSDDSMMATGSGDAEGAGPQLIVFDTQTGNATLTADLSGLAKELGAALSLFDIWSVDFVPSS